MRELRYAGVRAADLPSSAFTSAAKHAELVALLTAYERHLDAQHIADMPIVLQEAGKHLDWCPIATDDLVTEIPHTLWSPLVRKFLDGLPGTKLRPRALELADVHLPVRAAKLAAPVERVAVTSKSPSPFGSSTPLWRRTRLARWQPLRILSWRRTLTWRRTLVLRVRSFAV